LSLFNGPPPPHLYTLSLHDGSSDLARADAVRGVGLDENHALFVSAAFKSPSQGILEFIYRVKTIIDIARRVEAGYGEIAPIAVSDRKSTRLNSSHRTTSYAVFCLKK